MTADSTKSGFTLIEMLVALCLLSLLSLLMIATVPQLRAYQRLTVANNWAMEIDNLTDYVARELTSARRLPLMRVEGTLRPVFDGGPESVSFVAMTRVGSDQIALRDLTIGTANGALTLVERARRQSGNVSRSYPLSEHHLVIDLSYCALGLGGSGPSCQTDWRQERLPDFIRFTIALNREGQLLKRQRIVFMENVR